MTVLPRFYVTAGTKGPKGAGHVREIVDRAYSHHTVATYGIGPEYGRNAGRRAQTRCDELNLEHGPWPSGPVQQPWSSP